MNYFGLWLFYSEIGSKFSRHFFNQSEVKPKPIVAHAYPFSRALCRLRVITSSFDWFTGFSPSFWLAKVITLVLVLRHSLTIETRSKTRIITKDWETAFPRHKGEKTNRKWFSVVCTLMCSYIIMLWTHSAASRESTTFWPPWWRISLSIRVYIITQVIHGFWLVLAYDLFEDRRKIDVTISFYANKV